MPLLFIYARVHFQREHYNVLSEIILRLFLFFIFFRFRFPIIYYFSLESDGRSFGLNCIGCEWFGENARSTNRVREIVVGEKGVSPSNRDNI